MTVSNFVNITRVASVNGSVNATNIRGTAKLSTVKGEVIADFDRLENGTKISLETVNGQVNPNIKVSNHFPPPDAWRMSEKSARDGFYRLRR